MAVQQRKTAKARKRKRRSHDALPITVVGKCPKCSQAIQPHTVCANCGNYKGVQVFEIDDE